MQTLHDIAERLVTLEQQRLEMLDFLTDFMDDRDIFDPWHLRAKELLTTLRRKEQS